MPYKKANSKSKALGECIHRARRKIVNEIIRRYFQDKEGEIYCHRCGEEVTGEFHMDHIIPWINSPEPKLLYFDLNNIAPSHPGCNSAVSRSSLNLTHCEMAIRRKQQKSTHNKKYYKKRKQLRDETKHDNKAKS